MIASDGFRLASDGIAEILVDPSSDKDYAIGWEDWLNGDLINTVTASIFPTVVGVPYSAARNDSPVTAKINGVDRTFPIRTVSTCWLKSLTAGTVYTVTMRIVTAGLRTEERSFRVICRDR